MAFDNIKGNGNLISRLTRAVNSGSVSHAYIFTGATEAIRNEFATAFVQMVLCEDNGCGSCRICRKVSNGNHADVTVVEPEEGHKLLDDQVEAMQMSLIRRPLEGERNVAVIRKADTMTERAQNRLLKTLEEPVPGTVIILLADNSETFLQTILSRCALYRIEGADYVPSEEAKAKALMLEDMFYNGELFYRIKNTADDLAKDKDLTIQTLDSLQRIYRDMLISGDNRYSPEKIYSNIQIIEDVKNRIGRNVKISSALKYMMIKIGG